MGGGDGPYHYAQFFSNPGTVLFYNVRLPPFTKMLTQFNGKLLIL